MTISVKDRKMLWGRAGNRCAFERCRASLTDVETAGIAPTVLGEEAHIVAQSEDGPRGSEPVPGGNPDGYCNLILLCAADHKRIDDNPTAFTVDDLVKAKLDHERWVDEQLSPADKAHVRDDEIYAAIVDEWAARARLDAWMSWTDGLLFCGQPSLRVVDLERLKDLTRWLLTRVWPGSRPQLEAAFATFRIVANDLVVELERNGKRVGTPQDESIEVEKFYKALGADWNPIAYASLERKFLLAVDVMEELGRELTRAANLVCDVVRRTVAPAFRRAEGHLTIQSGPTIDAFDTYVTSVLLYPPDAEPASAYRGLAAIKVEAEGAVRRS